MTDMKVTYGDDGSVLHAEGGNGLSCEVDTRARDRALEVRYTLTPVGDDSLYGGTATVLVTLNAPDPGPNPPENAAEIGAKFAAGIIQSIPEVLAGTLVDSFEHAARSAREDVEEKRTNITALIKTIALLLLAANDGDVDRTKMMATRLMHGEEVPGLGGIDLPEAMTPEWRDDAIAKTHDAIDVMAEFIRN